MSKKLEDAIEAILAASRPTGCWATLLTGEAATLVARLREEEARGNKVSRAATKKILNDVYNVKASDTSIRAHLVKECRCE